MAYVLVSLEENNSPRDAVVPACWIKDHRVYWPKGGTGKMAEKKVKNTKKLYLMTTNKKLFYSQFDFQEVTSQNLLIREI